MFSGVVELSECRLLPVLQERLEVYKTVLPAMKNEKMQMLKKISKGSKKNNKNVAFMALEKERITNEINAVVDAVEALQKMTIAWGKVYSQMADLEFIFSQAMHATSLLHNMGRVQVSTPDLEDISKKHQMVPDDGRQVVERAIHLSKKLEPMGDGRFEVVLTETQRNLIKEMYFAHLPCDYLDEILDLPVFSTIPGFHLPPGGEIEKIQSGNPFEFVQNLKKDETIKYLKRGTAARIALAAVWHPFDYLAFLSELSKKTDRPMPMLLPPHTCARFLALEHLTKADINPGRGRLLDDFLIATPSQLDLPIGEYTEKGMIEATINLAWQYWRMAFGTSRISIAIVANRDLAEMHSIPDKLPIMTGVQKYKRVPMSGITRGAELFSIMMRNNLDLLTKGKNPRFSTPMFNYVYSSVLCCHDALYLAREFGAVNGYNWFSRMDWFHDSIATREAITSSHDSRIISMIRLKVLRQLNDLFDQWRELEAQEEYTRHMDIHRRNAKMVAGWFDHVGTHRKRMWLVLLCLQDGIKQLRIRAAERKEESVAKIIGWWRKCKIKNRMKLSLRAMVTAMGKIEHQLRFYFSDENLSRDSYLLDKIHPVLGVVPYPVLMNFPILMSQLCFFADQVDVLRKMANRIDNLEATVYGVRRLDWPTGYVPSAVSKYAFPPMQRPNHHEMMMMPSQFPEYYAADNSYWY